MSVDQVLILVVICVLGVAYIIVMFRCLNAKKGVPRCENPPAPPERKEGVDDDYKILRDYSKRRPYLNSITEDLPAGILLDFAQYYHCAKLIDKALEE